MFEATNYRNMYARFMGNLAQDVILQVNTGSSFTNAATVKAHVSAWKETDLVANATIQLGDLKLIIPDDGALPTLGLKDRIQINGRSFSVVHWDAETRSLGDEMVAIEVTVRG